MVKIKQP